MTATVWKVVRALAGLETGSACRCCNDPIPAGDPFGRSERVCRPCRDAAG